MSRAAVTVRHARWACVTAGEYDRRRGEVVVNDAVVDAVRQRLGCDTARVVRAIVAHELSHADEGPGMERTASERLARAAAVHAAGDEVVRAIDEVVRTGGHEHRTGR